MNVEKQIHVFFSFTTIQIVLQKCGPPEGAGPQRPVTVLTILAQFKNRGHEHISVKYAVVVITQQTTQMLKSTK